MTADAGARRIPAGPLRLLWYPRLVALSTGMLLCVLVLGASLAMTGTYPISVDELWRVLLDPDGTAVSQVVWGLRLPRVATGAATGACLGVAGLLFQSLSRNALGSPEIIGMVSGAALGAVVGVVLLGTHAWATAGCAVVGCLLATAVGYALAGSSTWHAQRFLLVGVGLSALWGAITTLLLTRSAAEVAITAQMWLVGTLNARTWDHALVPGTALAVLLPAALVSSRHLSALELGPDMATQQGVAMRRLGAAVALIGVGLTAAAVTGTGPLSFVALAAPHASRVLAGRQVIPVVTAALCGAALLLWAEWVIQHLPHGVQAPVGLATSVLGGLYLVIVVLRSSR